MTSWSRPHHTPCAQSDQVPLVSNDASQLDDGRVASYPRWGPLGVVNTTPLQCRGEGGAKDVLRENVFVVIVCGQLDVVLFGELDQILG